MYSEGLSFKEISEKRNIKLRTIEDHILKSAASGEKVAWENLFSEKTEKLILDTISVTGKERLRHIKEKLPEDIDYFTIKAVICKNGISESL